MAIESQKSDEPRTDNQAQKICFLIAKLENINIKANNRSSIS